MHGDLGAAVQMLAADNARLCDVGLAADELARVVEVIALRYRCTQPTMAGQLQRALDAYKSIRNGQ